METPTLGEARFASPLGHRVSDELRIPERIEAGGDPGLLFEQAGPRRKRFFNPKETVAGIVTCGGLCPGLNNVIRSLFFELHYGYPLSVVGVPKTIDNDVAFVSRTFGYVSAVEEAVRVLDCAHTEARSTPGGIGLVKLMGRHAGFITAGATVASQDVNFALVPEVPFKLDAFLAALEERMRHKSHAVIAVAEGAGQDLLGTGSGGRDASGNTKLQDIGTFLRGHIERHFQAVEIPVVMRYFDPSYQVRSRPANCEDSLLCDLFARNAVLAATGQPENLA